MRLIIKGAEPALLTEWKRNNPGGSYKDLGSTREGQSTRYRIRETAVQEQFYLCAFCCQRIDERYSSNEHLVCQSTSPPEMSLDFNNIVASCTTPNRCNNAHGSDPLPLTPLMPECETDLKFFLSGIVNGSKQTAIDSIAVLALDSPALRNERKSAIENLLFELNTSSLDLQLSSIDELHELITALQLPDENGKLVPFAPVLVNIVSQHLDLLNHI